MESNREMKAPIINEPVAAAAILPDAMTRLEQMAERSRAFRVKWMEWFHQQEKNVEICVEHDVPLEIDMEGSQAASWSEGRNVIRTRSCPKCATKSDLARENAILASAGVPGDMLHCGLNNWRPRMKTDHEVLERATEYARVLSGAFILMGKDFGVGKSHMAVGIMRRAFKVKVRGLFITHENLVRRVRHGYTTRTSVDITEVCSNVPLLVIDDLGLSSGGKDELPMLHHIFDTRKSAGRPFIITTNAPDMAAISAILGERMMDRLREFTFAVRTLAGESMRKAKTK